MNKNIQKAIMLVGKERWKQLNAVERANLIKGKAIEPVVKSFEEKVKVESTVSDMLDENSNLDNSDNINSSNENNANNDNEDNKDNNVNNDNTNTENEIDTIEEIELDENEDLILPLNDLDMEVIDILDENGNDIITQSDIK
jgi:hypothetical protein